MLSSSKPLKLFSTHATCHFNIVPCMICTKSGWLVHRMYFIVHTPHTHDTLTYALTVNQRMACSNHAHTHTHAVLMIRVEIFPDITLSFINTIIFSLIIYSKYVRSN